MKGQGDLVLYPRIRAGAVCGGPRPRIRVVGRGVTKLSEAHEDMWKGETRTGRQQQGRRQSEVWKGAAASRDSSCQQVEAPLPDKEEVDVCRSSSG